MMRARRRPGDLDALWKEKDVIDGRTVEAMVVIMRTRGCWWARAKGCSMCGYNSPSVTDVDADDLRAQIARAVEAYADEPMVKVYTSGSFLDEREVPAEVRAELFDAFDTELTLVESRPEFVTDEVLSTLPAERTAVAIGLESGVEDTLRRSVRKGFTVKDYLNAGGLLNDRGFRLRTYLLLKPPFLNEAQAIEDTMRSIELCHDLTWDISINPVNVQRGTMVEDMWRRGDYRPPWIWSLAEVLSKARDITDKRVFSSPSGGGSRRGVHNCGECDGKALGAIERYALSQDVRDLIMPPCGCKSLWAQHLEMDGALGTAVDVDRHINDELSFR